jgi:hypothetical protein
MHLCAAIKQLSLSLDKGFGEKRAIHGIEGDGLINVTISCLRTFRQRVAQKSP